MYLCVCVCLCVWGAYILCVSSDSWSLLAIVDRPSGASLIALHPAHTPCSHHLHVHTAVSGTSPLAPAIMSGSADDDARADDPGSAHDAAAEREALRTTLLQIATWLLLFSAGL